MRDAAAAVSDKSLNIRTLTDSRWERSEHSGSLANEMLIRATARGSVPASAYLL